MGNIASKSSFSSYIWIIKIISIAACISFLKDQDKMVNALRLLNILKYRKKYMEG